MLIETKNLTKIYKIGKIKIPAVSGVDLKIKKGEFVAIMGPSGSGKSTLMNLIGCLDKPTLGTYLLEGEDISKKSDRELAKIRGGKIGFVFQSFNLLPKYTALANVNLPLVYLGVSSWESFRRSKEALEKVGLGRRLYHRPNELSGGEIQRVAIARALVANPAVILADEPTGNLDSKSAIQIMEIFRKLNLEGVTIILVTHELHIAEYAARIIYLKDGKIFSQKYQ